MIVVFDTNVWVSDLALTSNVGSAVRFFLREHRARVGLPEVVRFETEVHLRTTLLKHIGDIQSKHRQLLSLFGRLKEVVLPTEEDVEELVGRVFSQLGVGIEEIPFSLDSAKDALDRTIRKIPPSDKDQQFKDGVIWADCRSMLPNEPVYLVTNDRAFYKARDTTQGLADELRREVHEFPNRLAIFPSLTELLSEIHTDIHIDQSYLLDEYWRLQGQRLEEMAARNQFVIEGDPSPVMESFVTENPSLLFVAFSIEFPCSDNTGDGRGAARILACGEGTYDVSAKRFTEISSRGEKLVYQMPDGAEQKVENIVLVAGGVVIGHRTVEHSVRYRL